MCSSWFLVTLSRLSERHDLLIKEWIENTKSVFTRLPRPPMGPSWKGRTCQDGGKCWSYSESVFFLCIVLRVWLNYVYRSRKWEGCNATIQTCYSCNLMKGLTVLTNQWFFFLSRWAAVRTLRTLFRKYWSFVLTVTSRPGKCSWRGTPVIWKVMIKLVMTINTCVTVCSSSF